MYLVVALSILASMFGIAVPIRIPEPPLRATSSQSQEYELGR